MTDGNGLELGLHHYYPFGEEATLASQDAERLKFTGHERDMLSGNITNGDSFDYMHARTYAPLLGRFISPDPLGGNLLAPQSWNRYAYVGDDPLTFSDPLGLLKSGTTKIESEGFSCPPNTDSCIDVRANDPKYDKVREMLREFNRFLAKAEQVRHAAELVNRRSASVPGWLLAPFSRWRGVRNEDTFVFQNDWWLGVLHARGVTYGNVVLVNAKGLSDGITLAHESKHVDQYSRQGLLFYPDYLTQYLFNWVAMGDRDEGYSVIRQELEANRQ